MVLESPIYISHMSFGALSKEKKEALSKGSSMAKTAMCSGEGGILPEEKSSRIQIHIRIRTESLQRQRPKSERSGRYRDQNRTGHQAGHGRTSARRQGDAEIAAIRGKEQGKDVQSPSKFPNINSKEDLKDLVSQLRQRSDGRPIGIKIAAGKIEKDLEFCVSQNLISSRLTDAAALPAPVRFSCEKRPACRLFMHCIVQESTWTPFKVTSIL